MSAVGKKYILLLKMIGLINNYYIELEILSQLEKGPMRYKDFYLGKRSKAAFYKCIKELIAQGRVSSLALSKRYRIYFLPLDINLSNCDHL
jgi:hypothetical protein